MVQSAEAEHLFKVLIIGESGVGKTCLLVRFIDDTFTPSFISTIGIDFKVKNMVVNGHRVKLQVWDTAGQERFRTITTAYYRGAQGFLLVYDVTDANTFANVKRWMEYISQHSFEKVDTALIGNKCDLEDKRAVSREEGQRFAQEHNMLFYETSALDATNINIAFEGLVAQIAARLLVGPQPTPVGQPTVKLQETPVLTDRWEGRQKQSCASCNT